MLGQSKMSIVFLMILSRVRGAVTKNNVFWIGWLDLLTPLQSLLNTMNYNNTVNLLPRTRSILVLLSQISSNYRTELTESSHVSSLYNFGKEWIEITTSNSSSIIACSSVAAEMCFNEPLSSNGRLCGASLTAFRRHVTVWFVPLRMMQ
jgi:hypothetical protein